MRRADREAHAPRCVALLLGAVLALAACGDDADAKPVTIELIAPSPGQVLTLAEDDADPDSAGLQFDVTGSSHGLDRGTTLNLFIDGERLADDGRVNLDGDVVIGDVTLPPGRHIIYLGTTTGSARSDRQQYYTFRSIEIASPADGARVDASDDRDAVAPGVQLDVSAASFGLDMDEAVALLLDGDQVAEAIPDEQGELVWSRVDVSNGAHTLQAHVGEGDDALRSAETRIDVADSCPSVTFLTPSPPDDEEDTISLGGEGECPSGNDPFTTDVSIATNAEDGTPVQLVVNGQQLSDGVVMHSTVTFEDVALGRRTMANEIEVQLDTPDGVNCPVPFPAGIVVDCAGVDCTIASPVPVEFIDDSGATSLYLNAGLRERDGFEIDVQSDAEIDGREVELIVDGNTRRAPRAIAQQQGDISIAHFDDLDLNEGAHTLEALCTDAAGNVTSSGEHSWIVDVTACDATITAPGAGAVLVPADDEDGASDGTQVVTSAVVVGGDCVAQRAATCDVDDGIGPEPAFVGYDGTSPLLATVTLDASTVVQNLCLEIADRAGNVARGSVAVNYRAAAPLVLIESPTDGDRFNVTGGGGYVADADPAASPTACDAVFSIACGELGVDVELYHDGESAPFATAACEAPDSADPELPAGYAGRAQVSALFEDGDATSVIVARQVIQGSSAEELVASSPAITVQGDCRRPGVSLSGDPCGVSTGNQLSAAQAAARDFGVFDNTMDIATATVSFSNTDGTMGTPAPSSTLPVTAPFSAVSWADVDLGDEGTVTLTVTVHDDFDNRSQIACSATILADLPVISSFTAPADGAIRVAADACNTGTVGEFGVRVLASADRQADRLVSVLVNDALVVNGVTPGAGGAIDLCVPVPDNVANEGPSTLVLRVASTLGPGVVEQSRDVHVVVTGPGDMTGILIDLLTAPELDDQEHRDGSLATWVLNEDYPGQLRSYAMRCDGAELLETADAAAKAAWWNAADDVDLDGLTPADDPEARIALRPEEPRHCVLRAADAASQLTPIVSSTELTLRLRQTVIATGGIAGNGLGAKVAPAGDVDNDGIDDVLVGGFGRTELIFGTPGDPTSAPRVTFTSLVSVVSTAPVALGDFNGDGLSDFAIGNAVADSSAGHVSIFFGRPRDQWPSTIDIETTCNADLCIEGAASSRLGRTTASAGDFNDDGQPDLALGSSPANQIFVLLGDSYEVRPCSACRATGESCVGAVCTRDLTPGPGEPAFWRLRFVLPTGDSLDPAGGPDLQGFELTSSGTFGVSIASMGAFDTVPGDDLAIGASAARQVHYLSGRDHTGPGIEVLATSDLGLPDVTTGVPDGMPIAALDLSAYGFVVANLGDFYQAAGATGAEFDLGVARVNQNEFYIVPGDRMSASDAGFSAASVRVSGAGNIGQSIATSWDPMLGLLGDVDGDGEPELCVGTRIAPHDILFWYPDRFAAAITADAVDRATGFSIVTETTATEPLTVQYVGDVNGDGHLDIAVGDLQANSAVGRLLLLY